MDGEHDVGLSAIEVPCPGRDASQQLVSCLQHLRNPLPAIVADRLGQPVPVELIVEEQRDLLLLGDGGVVAPLILFPDIDKRSGLVLPGGWIVYVLGVPAR